VTRHSLWIAFESARRPTLGAAELRPYWRRNGLDGSGLMALAAQDQDALEARARAFDSALQTDLVQLGGSEWAKLAALVWRQTLGAANLAVDSSGSPVLLPRAGGRPARTLDVVDGAPIFLATSPGLARALAAPLLERARSPGWDVPFAPVVLDEPAPGPALAVDPERVAATAGLLLLTAQIGVVEDRVRFAERYADLLGRWAESLDRIGLDVGAPSVSGANVLAPLDANAAQLSVLALGAWSQIAAKRGLDAEARRYRARAEDLARAWIARASSNGVAPTRLALDAEGSWSQRTALVWDRLLGLGLFPAELATSEAAALRARWGTLAGTALDSRSPAASLARGMWSAGLARDRAEFEALVKPLHAWVGTLDDRRPLSARYDAQSGRSLGSEGGIELGALFLRLLQDRTARARWSAQGARVPEGHAPYVPSGK